MGLSRDQLQAGDIILTTSQVFTNGFNGVHATIRLGEMLTPTLGGSSAYVHAQIVVHDPKAPNGPKLIAESAAPKNMPQIYLEPPTSPGTVFRLKESGHNDWKNLAARAGRVATTLVGKAEKKRASYEYSVLEAGYSTVRSAEWSENGQNLIKEIGKGTYTGGWFCSMFVIVCYQLAASAQKAPLPINVNANSLSPAALAGYFGKRGNWWENVGDYAGN